MREFPFILNIDQKVVHRAAGLTERCNTDQIKHRRKSMTIPLFYRLCEHCEPVEHPTPSPSTAILT